jgi:hypothetical protein
VLISGLEVSLADASGTALKEILSAAIGGAEESGNLNSFLRGEFIAAFHAAFPTYIAADGSSNTVTVDEENVDASSNGLDSSGGSTFEQTGQPGAGSTPGTASAASAMGASSVTQTSTINSYAFLLDVSGDVAAAEMADNLLPVHRNSLFMQLPVSNLKEFADASGNPTDNYRGLPLKLNDSVTFVFDVEVLATTDTNISGAASGNNATNTGNATNPSTVQQSINMDLGTRRVAVKVTQNVDKIPA